MNEVTAIPTTYAGVVFRSRLEARWAVFFDQLHQPWQYEAEGFAAADGTRFLPDFWLPKTYLRGEQGVYVEIKATPDDITANSDRFSLFEDALRLAVFAGSPPGDYEENDFGGVYDGGYQFGPWWDNCMIWFRCQHCGLVKIEFSEGNYMHCPAYCQGKDESHLWPRDPFIHAAGVIAKGYQWDWRQRSDNWTNVADIGRRVIEGVNTIPRGGVA